MNRLATEGSRARHWFLIRGAGTGTLYAGLNAALVTEAMAKALAHLIADRNKVSVAIERHARPLKNPTLVHHGLAKSARYHVVTAARQVPLADLYSVGLLAARRVAEDLATVIGLPVMLLSNHNRPRSLDDHLIVRDKGGHTTHGPTYRKNPSGSPRAGEIWTTLSGGRCRILAVTGGRVSVLHMETGRREWIDQGDFFASYRLSGKTPPRVNARGRKTLKQRTGSRVWKAAVRAVRRPARPGNAAQSIHYLHEHQIRKYVGELKRRANAYQKGILSHEAFHESQMRLWGEIESKDPAVKAGVLAALRKALSNPSRSRGARARRAATRMKGLKPRRLYRAMRSRGRGAKSAHYLSSAIKRQMRRTPAQHAGEFRNPGGNITLNAHEVKEFARAASAMYQRGRNDLGHLLSAVAAKRIVPIAQYDRAAEAYRAWLAFDEPKANPSGRKIGIGPRVPAVRADTLKVGDVVMPPAREVQLWMARDAAEKGMSTADLGIMLTDVHEGAPDKKGRWIVFKGFLRDEWYQGRRQYPFIFKARPETPWPVVAMPQANPRGRNPRGKGAGQPRQGNDRDFAVKVIRDNLKKRSGKSWSVTVGRGTAWGWLHVDAPNARRTWRWRLKPGMPDQPENYQEFDSGQPGGHSGPAERAELATLLGLERLDSYQGVSIPGGSDYYDEYMDRAQGRVPERVGKPYWDNPNPKRRNVATSGGRRVARRRPRRAGVRPNPRSEKMRAAAQFQKWQDRPDARGRWARMKAPKRVPRHMAGLGELVEVVYRSNKYDGKQKLYKHRTKRPRPVLATDPDGRDVFVVGGNMKVTADGLDN